LVVAAGILFSYKTVIRLGRTSVPLRGIASLSSERNAVSSSSE
jgi:hypothetical protein